MATRGYQPDGSVPERRTESGEGRYGERKQGHCDGDPEEQQEDRYFDKAVQNDTELSGVSKEKTNKVRLIDKEVSNDVTTSSGKN